MRTLKKVRKISHDNFVESYGVMNRSKSVDGRAGLSQKKPSSQSTEMFGTFRRRKTSYSSMDESTEQADRNSLHLNDNRSSDHTAVEISSPQLVSTPTEEGHQTPTLQAQSEVSYKGPSNRRLRRFSLKKFPSTGDIHKASSRRSKSEGNDFTAGISKDDGSQIAAEAPGRITSWHASFSINKRIKGSSTSLRSKSPGRTLFRVPALSMVSASQSGYLDRRNRKKKWEKFWCVLHDSCLFCYNSPQSEFTQDAVVLRGYTVSADMSDVQRAKFTFKLEKKGQQTYHFRCDNHKTFMQWICMIKKESSQTVPDASDNEILLNSVKNSTQPSPKVQQPSNSPNQQNANSIDHKMLSRRHTADNIFRLSRREHLNLELQKENLLREVLEQQKEIIKERNSILSSPSPEQKPYYVPLVRDLDSPKPTKNEVVEKYERVKETQQMKILKSLTQLHRRRNSVQLKIDQLSRDARPKRASRHASRYVIQSMEARLTLLKSELSDIDQEIREQQASKEEMIDSLNHKRDLEIMVLDQQECLDIVKRGQPSPYRYQERGRRPTRRQSPATMMMMTSSSHVTEQLTSIDETSTVVLHSDSSSTSSGLSNSCIELNSHESTSIISSTSQSKNSSTFELAAENEISSTKARDCFRSSQSISASKSSTCSSDAEDILSVEGALSDDFRSLSTSSYSDLEVDCRTRTSSSDESLGHNKKKDEIRPDVLAEIEEFEVFSKMMLQRLHSAKC